MVNPQLENKIEVAIRFLAKAMDATGKNPKPVTLHSARVALYLYSLDAGEDAVIAAVLHDILEDSNIKREELQQSFGNNVAELVSLSTFDGLIVDAAERYRENYRRAAVNKDALIIRAADILDNSNYYQFAESDEARDRLLEKMRYYLGVSKPIIGDEKCWQDLESRCQLLIA